MSDDLDMEIVGNDELDDLGFDSSSSTQKAPRSSSRDPENETTSSNHVGEEAVESDQQHEHSTGLRPEASAAAQTKSTSLSDFTAELLTGGRPKGGGDEEGDYVSIGGTQVSSGGQLKFQDLTYISEDYFPKVKDTRLRRHDILIVKDGSNTGDVALSWRDHTDVVTNEHLFTLRLKPELNSPFASYFLQSHEGWKQLKGVITGSAQLGLTKDFVSKVDVPEFPLPEQRKIASVLYAVDQAIQKTEAIIEQAKRVKRGLVRDLMSHGLGGETQSVRLGPKEFSVPKSWKMVKLGELFDLVNGRVFDKNEWSDQGVRIIRIQDLREDADSSVNYCNHEIDEKYHVKSGDLLFCWAGNIKTSLGAYIWKEGRGYLNQHIYNMNPKVEVDLRFFKYAINRYLRIIKTMAGGSAGQVHVTKTDFERFELPVPDLRTQRLIAQRLNSAEEHAERVKDELSQLARLKKGLMQDLLTGKVRTADKAIEVLDEVAAHG